MRKYIQFTLPALLSVALYGITVFFIILPRMEAAVMSKKRETTRELVRTVVELLTSYQEDVNDGRMQIETAQKRALKRIRALRYGPNMKEYFWINDLTPRMIMHPYRSDLDNRDLTNFTDPDGKKIFVEVVRAAGRGQGGFVEYAWQHHDDPDKIIPKISYVYHFKPWGWVIGSGLYYDDVAVEIRSLTGMLTLIGAGVFLLVGLLSVYVAWRGMVVMKEKQRMMDSLRRSEARFRGISAGAHDGIVMITPHGKVSFWNAAAEKIFGYQAAEVLGRDLHELLAPSEQFQLYAAASDRFRESGKGAAIGKTLELPAVHKDGHEIPIELSVSTLNFDGDWHAVGIVRDVTAKKQAEAALQESETKYRTLFDATNDIILLMDDDVIVECNDRALDIFHTDKAGIIGRTPLDFSPALQADGTASQTAARQYIDAAKNDHPQHFEWIHHNLEREIIYTDVFLKKIVLLGKEFILGVCRDITERRQAEEALLKSAALVKAAGRIARVGGWSADLVNRTVTWSDEVAAIHGKEAGYSPTLDEVYQFAAPEWKEQIVDLFHQCAHAGTVLDHEFEIIAATGERKWVRSTGEVVRNASGEAVQMRGALQDITAYKRIEKSLHQAQKMEAIGTLAAGIAHDFNNVLWGVLGFSEMALTQVESEPEKARYSIERVLESGNRAKYIVQQILQFSRQSEIAMGPLDVDTILKEVVKLLRATVPSNFEIHLNIAKGAFRVHADATQIHQVLMNLATNAYHAMRHRQQGQLSIALERIRAAAEIKCHSQIMPAGEYVCIRISDTGHGIDAAYLDKIFDPYYTTKGKGEGTGLGLAVSFGIIKSHNGGIAVTSRKETGTTFSVYLPPKDDEAVEVVAVNEEIRGGKERILFVDDERAILEMMESSLEGVGYSVTGFNHSPDALRYFSAHPDQFDLVITDQTMPRLTGLELANRIHDISPLPIILCTGFSETISADDLTRNGISLILKKPLLRRELTESIRRILNETNDGTGEHGQYSDC